MGKSTRLQRMGMLSALAAILAGCGGQVTNSDDEAVAVSTAAIVAQQSFNQLTITLPADLRPEIVALGSLHSLSVRNGAIVKTAKGTPAKVANSGPGALEVSAGAKVGPAYSVGPIWVRSGAVVDGAATTAGIIDVQQGGSVIGPKSPNSSVGPMRDWTWKPILPTGTPANASLEPSKSSTISPGVYADTYIKQNATLTLKPGVYRFEGLSFEPGSTLKLQASDEPTIIYVNNNFTFRGQIVQPANAQTSVVPLLVVALGRTVAVEKPFVGNIFAPNGRISLGAGTHKGNFFGADVELQPYAVLESHPFFWSRIIPSGPFDFRRSPIEINAWKELSPGGTDHPSEVTLDKAVEFKLPQRIWVRTGNAGNGRLQIQYRNGTNAVITCLYQGAASVAHPTTDRERARGLEYRFVSCSNGTAHSQAALATWMKVSILGGDDQGPLPEVAVQLGLGGGCSDILDPELSPYEVTVLREEFNWTEAKALPMNDPSGHPAIWHAMIYVDRKEQLAALDRLRVMWSTLPLSAEYTQPWQGRCGRVGHATDGKGIVVYAIIPANVFNILMKFGIQAENAGIAPPFKFIIPSTPPDPGAANADGSLSYEALAQSGYLQWLQERNAASPWIGGDLWNAVNNVVSGPVTSAVNWITGTGGDIVETAIDYADKGFDAAIDWAANAVDNVWETIQDWLQEIVLLAMDKSTLNMNIRITNRDEMFNPSNSLVPFERAWGPNDSMGRRPIDVPEGASIRVRQWGAGFLPVMDETRISGSGYASLEAVKGSSIRSSGTCIELETDYAMMTSDLVPNEVCNFDVGLGGSHFYDDFDGDVWVDQTETFALTQIHDSYSYARDVIGYEPRRVDVLLGSQANNATGFIKQFTDERTRVPSTLCLDFAGAGLSMLQTTAAGMGALIFAAGGGPAAILPIAESEILAKDIWWPSAGTGGRAGSLDSRGIMTHEYGHFLMCSMAYDESSTPVVLRGLVARLFETNLTRSSEVTLMTETFADTFAMQVVGGSNYIHPAGSSDRLAQWNIPGDQPAAPMGWCVSSPCMDFNYRGSNDFTNHDPFIDELARYQGLVYDAFDLANGGAHFPHPGSSDANVPNNGDDWEVFTPTSSTASYLRPSANAYIASNDEPVSLRGPAWRTWVHNWLKHGRVPNKKNMLKGLADTMKSYDARWGETFTTTWCDRCEVFAPHYGRTPDAARMPDTTGTRTLAIRQQRWQACIDDGEMHSMLGRAPERYGNLTAFCEACPPLHSPDGSGGCTPCPPNQVPRGALGCQPCPRPTDIVLPNNECQGCGSNQIEVSNVCQDCPAGTGADKASNQCVACPADATLTLSRGLGTCANMRIAYMAYSGVSPDVCPDEFWLEVTGLGQGAVDVNSASYVTVTATPEDLTYPTWNVPQSECSTAQATVAVYDSTAGTSVGSVSAGATYKDTGLFGGCLGAATVKIPVSTIQAGMDSVRVKARLQVSGHAVDGAIYVSTPECDGGNI